MKRIIANETRCTGCRVCESVCSYAHEQVINPSLARIVVFNPGILEEKLRAVVCRQCELPSAPRLFLQAALGSGLPVKLINRLLFALDLASVTKVFTLAAQLGIELNQMVEVFLKSSPARYALKTRYDNFIAKNHFEPGFETNLILNDLSPASQLAKENDMPLLLGETVLQFYRLAKR